MGGIKAEFRTQFEGRFITCAPTKFHITSHD